MKNEFRNHHSLLAKMVAFWLDSPIFFKFVLCVVRISLLRNADRHWLTVCEMWDRHYSVFLFSSLGSIHYWNMRPQEWGHVRELHEEGATLQEPFVGFPWRRRGGASWAGQSGTSAAPSPRWGRTTSPSQGSESLLIRSFHRNSQI